MLCAAAVEDWKYCLNYCFNNANNFDEILKNLLSLNNLAAHHDTITDSSHPLAI